MLIDSHAHILGEYYDDIKAVIEDAKNNNVMKIINCATSINDMDEIVKVSNDNDLNYALGIHPEEADKLDEVLKQKLEGYIVKNISDRKFIAIGEIGLDYYYTKETKDKQLELFDFQLSLAEKYKKPVIVHSREATLDTINLLKKHNVKGVIHCFSGSYETAYEYIRLGFMLGIGGVITFKNCNLKDYIDKIGVENIVLETDSPFMTPEPYRKNKNEPKYVLETAKFISNLMNIPLEELEEITTKNCNKIFDIR